jgi:hypothetical protein
MHSRLAALAPLATAAVVALALVVGGAVAPASAATNRVLLSRDGVTFISALSGGLFDGAHLLVPGQSVSRSLWIRNPSSTTRALRVTIRHFISSSLVFADGVTLSWFDSLPGSTRVTHALSALDACEVVSSAPAIAAGGTAKLTLTFTMADLTAQLAQSDRTSLDLVVAMRDAASGAYSGSACRDNSTLFANTGNFRTVAFTGGSPPVPLIVGGGVLLGVGMCLIVARLRRES